MKNRLIKIIITISFIFSFIPITYAGVNKDECTTTIERTSCAEPNGFKTNVKTCVFSWNGSWKNIYSSTSSWQSVVSKLNSTEFVQMEDSSGKGSIFVQAYACGPGNSNLTASITLSASINIATITKTVRSYQIGSVEMPCQNFNGNPSGCYSHKGCSWNNGMCTGSWYENRGTSCPSSYPYKVGNERRCYQNCPAGFTHDTKNPSNCIGCATGAEYKDGKCIISKTETYTYSGENAKNNNLFPVACSELKKSFDIYGVEPSYCTTVSAASYSLDCKVFACNSSKEQEIGVNTPSFKVNGATAYCINPSHHFEAKEYNYKEDNDFDVTNCKNSFNSVDCGYANILIEGRYHKLEEKYEIQGTKAIELAMRLWGAHSRDVNSGFDDVGISSYVGDKKSCVPNVSYSKDTPNLYVTTLNYIWNEYMSSLKSKDYIDVSQAESIFRSISCDSKKLGLVCGDSRVYKQAFALFFNTVFGNKYMQSHLEELFGVKDTVNVRPTEVGVERDEENTEIVLTFDRTVTNITKKEYDCSKLDQENLTDEQKNYIKQYCSVAVNEFCVVNKNGECEPINVNNNDKIYDASKGQIKVKTSYFAPCEVADKTTYKSYNISVDYPKNELDGSIKRYISCGAASNQFLYAFLDGGNTNGDDTENSSRPTVNYSVSINCAGVCKDYNIKKVVPTCQDKDNTVYTGYVKDPSLKCIVNMYSDTNKTYYDYSDYFKVNKNLCRVYCSDEVDYYLADKVTINSGRFFTYDINPDGLMKNGDYKISSVIEEKRSCVSEIYLTKNFPTSLDWQKLYGLDSDEIDKILDPNNSIKSKQSINNIKDLLTVLFVKAESGNGYDKSINQVLYDLYNCNFYSNIPITKPDSDKNGNLYLNLKSIFDESHSYGLNNNNNMSNVITYVGGAEYSDKQDDLNKAHAIGSNALDINIEKNQTVKYTLPHITYCSADNCMNYDEKASQDENYLYSGFGGSTEGLVKDQLAVKNLSLSSRLKTLYNAKIPINNYVLFDSVIQIDFYNNTRYQIQAYSGNIREKQNSNSGDYVDLEAYSYPMSKTAYVNPNCENNPDDKITRCEITQTLSNMKTYYRNRPSDSFSNTLNDTRFTTFTCHIDVKEPSVTLGPPIDIDPGGGNVIYRNVDLSNLFPSDVRQGGNWQTEIGKIATNEIETSASSINTTKYLEYSFDLTPQNIRSIREYNNSVENQGGYLNNTLTGCTAKDGKFFDCKSSFLTEIAGGNSIYVNNTSPNNKFDGVSEYTQSIKAK